MLSRWLVVGVLVVAIVEISTVRLMRAAESQWSGTWRLNVAKSKYDPPAPPVADTQTIEVLDNGIHVTGDAIISLGRKTHTEYTVMFDGKDYPQERTLDGKPETNGPDSISAKKIDDETIELTYKRDGNVIATSRDVISEDGKMRTVNTTGTTGRRVAPGQLQTFNTTTVWEKQ